MIPVLQSRWRLEGNRLVYYGLRNAPNTLRRKVTVTPSEARAIAALDGSVPLKELPDGGKALRRLVKLGIVVDRSARRRAPASLEEAMALTERLDAYSLDRSAASPEDVARGELRSARGEEQAALLCRYLNLYGYGEALIQQYGGELTDYGLLTRADSQPVQEPLPPQPKLGGMEMR